MTWDDVAKIIGAVWIVASGAVAYVFKANRDKKEKEIEGATNRFETKTDRSFQYVMQRIQNLEAELQAEKAKNSRLENDYQHAMRAIGHLENLVNELQSEREDLRSNVLERDKRISQLEAEIKQLKTTVRSVTGPLSNGPKDSG